MAYSAQFQADFTRWDKALSDAKAGLKSFELTGKSVQNQLTRMTNGFSGATIQKEAVIAANAVKAIGGASKLTEAEQKKVNATVTEAIAKYKALGQQAPAELKKLQSETAQVSKATSGMTSALASVGAALAAAFTVTAITSAVKKTVEYASSIKDMSNQTGIGVKRLQELKFAAEQSGVSFDAVGTSIFNIQKSLGKGGDGVTGALAKLGLSLNDMKGLRPEDQFQTIASRLGKMKDETDRVAVGTALMGKSFKDVLPLIREGIDEQIAKAREWGVVIDSEAIDALENMGDAWEAVKLKGTALIAQALVPMVPAITKLLNAVGPLVGKFSELPAVFLKAEIAFNRFLQQQSEGAVQLLQLSKFSPLGAANLVTGHLDRQIGEARLMAAGFKGIVKGLETDLKNLKKVTDDVAAPADTGGGGGGGGASAATEAFLKSVQALNEGIQEATKNGAPLKLILEEYGKQADELVRKAPLFKVALTSPILALDRAFDQSQFAAKARSLVNLWTDFGPAIRPTVSAIDAALNAFDGLSTKMDTVTGKFLLLSRRVVEFNVQMRAVPEAIKGTAVAAADAALRQKEAAEAAKAWRDGLEDVAQAFATLSQAAGGSLSKIFSGIGKVVGSINLMVKSVDGIKAGLKGIDAAKGIKEMVAGFAQLTTGILGAAAAAIEFGQALWDAFTKSRAEQTAERIGREFGVAVSEEFAATIEAETAKFFGNRQAAQIFNLDRIIAEGGGLSAENIRPLFARFRDLFSMLETGAFSSAQAVEVLDKNFREFADFVTSGGSLASKELLEIINLTEQTGLKSAEVSRFVVEQTGAALGGLATFLNNAKVTTQEAANGITAALFGIFEAQSANGVPMAEIVKQLDPLIKQLDEQLIKAGLSGGESFRLIKELAATASHEIAGPLITGVLGLEQALAGLHNAGVLNEEMFDGLTASVADTYAQILATGVDGSQALQLIGPTLQTIWELNQDFGYTVDETTQKLLDEAEAAGVVGDAHRTAQEQMLRAMDRTADAIEALVLGFGFTLPNAIDDTADAINALPDEITIKGRYIPPDFQDQSGSYPTEVIPMAEGGMGRVTKPTLFLAGEAGPEEYAFSGAGKQFAGGSGGGNVTLNITVAGRATRRDGEDFGAGLKSWLQSADGRATSRQLVIQTAKDAGFKR